MSDRFYTFMIVPEKGDRIRKFSLPFWVVKSASVFIILLLFLGTFVFLDYLHVLSQVAENKKLRVENHKLKSEIGEAHSRLESLDLSVARIKSFAQKLRIISNLGTENAQQLLEAPLNALPSRDDENDSLRGPRGQYLSPDPVEQRKASPEQLPSFSPSQRSASLSPQQQQNVSEFARRFSGDPALPELLALIKDHATDLIDSAQNEERELASLGEELADRKDRLLRTPSIVPTRGWVSSDFGWRRNAFSGLRTFHSGLDIANNPGTAIYAPADGLVTLSGNYGGLGLVVRIDHGYDIVTLYGHNSELLVANGSFVRRGDMIARMGSTGRSTGPHLHYQIEIAGTPVNPRFFMLSENF